MKKLVSYYYWSDANNDIRAGKCFLYRNELWEDEQGNREWKYSTDDNAIRRGNSFIKDSQPVAFGVTAHFASMSSPTSIYHYLYDNVNFNAEKNYQIYHSHIYNRYAIENKRKPIVLSNDELKFEFLTEHIKEETQNLEKSGAYYEILDGDPEPNLKSEIRSYVLGYCSWIQVQLANFLAEHPDFSKIESQSTSPAITEQTSELVTPFSQVSYDSFIKITEWILKIINSLFKLQADPLNEKNHFSVFVGQIRKDLNIDYYWKIDKDILSAKAFSNRLRNMLLDKNVDNDGLKISLRACLELAESNNSIFDTNLSSSNKTNSRSILSFDHSNISYGLDNSIHEGDTSYQHYSNLDFAKFSNNVAVILKETLFKDEYQLQSLSPLNTQNKLYSLPDHESIHSCALMYESFFNFIIRAFQLQMHPGDDAIFADTMKLGFDHNSKFEYHVLFENHLADLNYFKTTINKALLSPYVDKPGLAKLFKETLLLTNRIISIYDHEFQYHSLSRIVPIIIKYKRNILGYYPIENPSYDNCKVLDNYSISNLARDVFNFLKSKVFTSESFYDNLNQDSTVENNFESEQKIEKTSQKSTDHDRGQPNDKGIDPNSAVLHDIWRGSEGEYNSVIKILIQKDKETKRAFATQDGSRLSLNTAIRGIYKYLAALTHILLNNKYIDDLYSAPNFVKIYQNTFQIPPFDSKPFKSIKANAPEDQYLKPFLSIPVKKGEAPKSTKSP